MEQIPGSYNSGPAPADLATTLTKRRAVSRFRRFEMLLKTFSPAERLLLYVFTAILALSTLAFLAGINNNVSVLVPAPGGTFTEGVVGTARFINPLLALSSPDRDIGKLVYSGLTRVDMNGSMIPDLASSYQISEDGTTYTFTLRPGLTFHDGSPLTSADVLFTVRTAQNPDYKSPRRADWEGVSVSAPDEKTIVFTLPKPYAPFLENTTLGILPAHAWQEVPAEEFPFSSLNVKPIGSGPYKINDVDTDKSGAATRYVLTPFNKFALGAPHLQKITFELFSNNESLIEAWNAGAIDGFAAISPSDLSMFEHDANVLTAPLPRVFGVFFNQDHAPVLADKAAREALDAAVDKEALIQTVLEGYGIPLDSPIPPGILASTRENAAPFDIERARIILEDGGWTFDEEDGLWKKGKKDELTLSFALATADSPELQATAQTLAANWRELGVPVDVHVYPLSELNNTVMRPRAYDAILFGEVVGRTLDLFAFWHSSQRNDPGLNLALYTNSRTDSLLAEARATTVRREREALYERFADIIRTEHPAVFLYAPQLLYVFPAAIHGVELGSIVTPEDRFANVYEWYTGTERVWSIFTNNSD